eukprot:765497-Hanusia_phi.AAC.5
MESKGHRKSRSDDAWGEEFGTYYHQDVGAGEGDVDGQEGSGEGGDEESNIEECDTESIAQGIENLDLDGEANTFSEPVKNPRSAVNDGRSEQQRNVKGKTIPAQVKNVMELEDLRVKYNVGSWAGRARLAKLERMRDDPRMQIKLAQRRDKAEILQQHIAKNRQVGRARPGWRQTSAVSDFLQGEGKRQTRLSSNETSIVPRESFDQALWFQQVKEGGARISTRVVEQQKGNEMRLMQKNYYTRKSHLGRQNIKILNSGYRA